VLNSSVQRGGMLMNYTNIISFWFKEIEPKQWWIKDLAFDQLITDKFLAIHQQASQCELFEWRATAQGRLAEIIILDQFSRNMFRDTPQAFSSDPLALTLAQEAISLGKHLELTAIERSFLYMPFMHSESLKIHEIAVELYRGNGIESNFEFEVKHRDIIEQYGRYPHRNAILDRISTAKELTFLQQPGSSF
jgi:uncharacterized protein (DUF924 family)